MDNALANLLSQAGSGMDNGEMGVQGMLSAPEAERMIEQLKTFSIADVGSPRWHTQREWIYRMNTQAVYNAATHSEEFIVELFTSLDKIHILVHELLVIEGWKQAVYPHLKTYLANHVGTPLTYLVLYHECVIANLLECMLFHSHACAALPEEHLLELADWTARKLAWLNGPEAHEHAEFQDLNPKDLLNQTPAQDLEQKRLEIEFGTATCSLSIARYLCDNLPTLPLGLMGRLLTTNDFPMSFVALLDNPPWTRRGKKGRMERWVDNKWQAVEPADRLKVSKADAQVWLALNSLIVEPRCRAKYSPDEHRQDKMLSLKRHMHELLLDQLPVLKDLQRTLDEMALGVAPDAASSRGAALLLEVVPELRTKLLDAVGNAVTLAALQAKTYFSEAESRKNSIQLAAALFGQQLDALIDMNSKSTAQQQQEATGNGTSACKSSQLPGPVRVTCSRKAHDSGVYEWWCDLSIEVDVAKPAEHVTLEHLQGLRYRLLQPDSSTAKPLPADGKISVKVSQQDQETLVAAALLQLPEIPVKTLTSEKPPIVWVTVGLLAVDGFALQLKLKRNESTAERDKVSGVWYAYQPVGGALTVLHNNNKADTAAETAVQKQNKEQLAPAIGLQGIRSSSDSNMVKKKQAPSITHVTPAQNQSNTAVESEPSSSTTATNRKHAVATDIQAVSNKRPLDLSQQDRPPVVPVQQALNNDQVQGKQQLPVAQNKQCNESPACGGDTSKNATQSKMITLLNHDEHEEQPIDGIKSYPTGNGGLEAIRCVWENCTPGTETDDLQLPD